MNSRLLNLSSTKTRIMVEIAFFINERQRYHKKGIQDFNCQFPPPDKQHSSKIHSLTANNLNVYLKYLIEAFMIGIQYAMLIQVLFFKMNISKNATNPAISPRVLPVFGYPGAGGLIPLAKVNLWLWEKVWFLAVHNLTGILEVKTLGHE